MLKLQAKSILLIVSLSFIFCNNAINAQNILGGINLEANMSNFILDNWDDTESKLGFGISVGGYTKIGFTECFGIQPEILLHYKTSTLESKVIKSDSKTDYQYFGVEIPIYAVGQKVIGNGNGFIGIGPYIGVGIDARYKADGIDDVELYKEYNKQKSTLQRFDFGAGIMLGYEFNNRLQIRASYKIGFINVLNANKDNSSMLNQTIGLGLGYRFTATEPPKPRTPAPPSSTW